MNHITSEHSNTVYNYLRETNGDLVVVSIKTDPLYPIYDDYQKSILVDDQEYFISVSKKFMEWFDTQNLINNNFYSETDPYLSYINLSFKTDKIFYNAFSFDEKRVSSTKFLYLTADIRNTFAKSKLEVRLYANDLLLDSPLIIDEYKECFNRMLDIFEYALLAKGMKMYEEIDGIVKFPI